MESFAKWLKDQIALMDAFDQKFLASYAENPASAILTDTLVKYAARRDPFAAVLGAIENGRTAEDIMSYALNMVIKKASFPPKSTSQMDNLFAVYSSAAWAEIVDRMKMDGVK